MMMMSPSYTCFDTQSPTIRPLHEGPLSVVVTELSGEESRPFMIWPPVTRTPEPCAMMYVSVWCKCMMPDAPLSRVELVTPQR
jgi:hypothetical protein